MTDNMRTYVNSGYIQTSAARREREVDSVSPVPTFMGISGWRLDFFFFWKIVYISASCLRSCCWWFWSGVEYILGRK